jgi:hypothetical protein
MLVRFFWRDCDFSKKERKAKFLDAFWVEATKTEVEDAIFPYLQADAVEESRLLADKFYEIAKQFGNPTRPSCFLIARDLSTINPFPVNYPFHHMWNAYSPFESMPEKLIAQLQELRSLIVQNQESV